MKYVYVLILGILSYNSYGQKQTEKFKGANTITLVTTIPQDSLFIVFGKALLDKNYIIIEKDNDFKTLRVKGSPTKYSIDMILNVRVKDSAVVLYGNFIVSKYRMEIAWAKGKNVYGASFDAMDDLAKSVPGEVYYDKVRY